MDIPILMEVIEIAYYFMRKGEHLLFIVTHLYIQIYILYMKIFCLFQCSRFSWGGNLLEIIWASMKVMELSYLMGAI